MRMSVVLVPVMLALTLSGCQTLAPEPQRGQCGIGDHRPWSEVTEAMTPASELQALAEANPNFPGTNQFDHESWYALPTGEFMLCRSIAPPQHSCSGQWWQFQRSGESHVITAQDAWICIT